MDNQSRSPVTYRALKRAILKLGFKETITETHLLYENAANGAIVLLPKVEDDQQARLVHLQTARWTAVETGLTDAASFDRLLATSKGRSKARVRAVVRTSSSARPRRHKRSSEAADPSPVKTQAA